MGVPLATCYRKNLVGNLQGSANISNPPTQGREGKKGKERKERKEMKGKARKEGKKGEKGTD